MAAAAGLCAISRIGYQPDHARKGSLSKPERHISGIRRTACIMQLYHVVQESCAQTDGVSTA